MTIISDSVGRVTIFEKIKWFDSENPIEQTNRNKIIRIKSLN
tara:strand:- start:279 stop:404 length:126 start_codon:yes stop_codon:yes gene_type:complete